MLELLTLELTALFCVGYWRPATAAVTVLAIQGWPSFENVEKLFSGFIPPNAHIKSCLPFRTPTGSFCSD